MICDLKLSQPKVFSGLKMKCLSKNIFLTVENFLSKKQRILVQHLNFYSTTISIKLVTQNNSVF